MGRAAGLIVGGASASAQRLLATQPEKISNPRGKKGRAEGLHAWGSRVPPGRSQTPCLSHWLIFGGLPDMLALRDVEVDYPVLDHSAGGDLDHRIFVRGGAAVAGAVAKYSVGQPGGSADDRDAAALQAMLRS